jgi:Zn-dependent protease with chaperone function
MLTAALLVVASCLLTSVTLAPLADRLVKRARPSTAVPLLAGGSLINAAALGLLLTLLGLAVAGRLPEIATAAGWSTSRLETALPVPAVIGVLAGATAAVLLTRTLWRAGTILVLLVRSDRLSRQLSRGGSPIVFVDTDRAQADAYTLAGTKGCVVISRQLFDALGPREQQMLTGHELSHLRRRHHLYVHAVDLAAAANPALRRVADAVRLGVERWADEDAAAMMAGDRTSAATALATTALTRAALRRGETPTASRGQTPTASRRRPVVPVLGVATSHVTQRAQALLAPMPERSALAAWVAVLLLAMCAAALASAMQIHDGFEHAEILQRIISR